MKRVRSKLGDDATRPTYIFTEQGVGYRMPEPGDVSLNPPPRDPQVGAPQGVSLLAGATSE